MEFKYVLSPAFFNRIENFGFVIQAIGMNNFSRAIADTKLSGLGVLEA